METTSQRTEPGKTIEVLSAGSRLRTPERQGKPTDELWLTIHELESVTGWLVKPEGLCRDDSCVPLTASARGTVHDGEVCASALWRELDRPVLGDAAGKTWVLGESASDRQSKLESLEAPDFTLPDIEGKLHSLSDYRGKKVLLATWASW